MRDLERELKERDEGWPPAWRAQPGEHLIGTLRRYATGTTAYGEVRTVLVDREDGQGAVSVWLSGTVLLAEFEREKPQPGERIGISYQGKHARGYHRYALVVDREPAPPDFTPLGGESDDQIDDVDPFPDLDREEEGETLPYATTVVIDGARGPMQH